MLGSPNIDDPLVPELAHQYKTSTRLVLKTCECSRPVTDRAEFDRIAGSVRAFWIAARRLLMPAVSRDETVCNRRARIRLRLLRIAVRGAAEPVRVRQAVKAGLSCACRDRLDVDPAGFP